ncbi:MAG: DUF2325 domain-containing protein [Thermoanaerobacteraceae bacterium]|jgi:hypothetical protein|nr:DUF2325 domain-containing protein [Thermoanaerobacteraceae bacterium]
MSAMIIGGDKLGNIYRNLEKNGYKIVKHITGRKKREIEGGIPCDVDTVFVFIDYVKHEIVNIIKKEGKKRNLKMVFVKRSWSHIAEEVENINV